MYAVGPSDNLQQLRNKISPLITIKGYFVEYDRWNRAKLMFLDDYDGDLSKMSFAKSYMINKAKKIEGKNPLVDDNKYMWVNCTKNQLGNLPDNTANKKKIKIVPVKELIQHTVICVVSVNKYKFKKNKKIIQGWNIKLTEMTLLEQ
jgi:hypothetical protein